MRKALPAGLIVVLLLCTPAGGEVPGYELVQPTLARQGTLLYSAPGKARVERRGSAIRTVPLLRDELLGTVAETRGGWTAAGLRRREARTELVLIRQASQGLQRLEVPEPQRHRLRLRPSLLVEGEQLVGLAWLEGPDLSSLSVRAASWSNESWVENAIVAPRAPGSQTGLTGGALADGSRLLVWAAFDGRDDEILWSRGVADRWSKPRRIAGNNSVPDIQPALIATADGALVVWSRLVAGEYRLVMARFGGSGWSAPQAIGPPGSLEAGFTLQHGQIHLLYRHAWPRAWALLELDATGRTRRWTVIDEGSTGRPALVDSFADQAELRWPGRITRTGRWEMSP